MPTKRDVLLHLTRAELLAVVDCFELSPPDRRAKDRIVEVVAASKKATLPEILAAYTRDRLKELCRLVGLDDSGKEKAAIIERLAGSKPPASHQTLPSDAAPSSASSPKPPTPKRSKAAKAPEPKNGGGDLGFERTLFLAADKLRNNMDAAEYKHVVLGLIFLKYISDAFEELHARLTVQIGDGADPEQPDEYRAERVFWVPKEARWAAIQANAKQATIGQIIDEAMVAIERDNPSLKGVLPKNFGRPQLDKQRLGEVVDLIGTIGLGSKENRSKDVIGRVYEYFLSEFALAEGKKGGQFYTPGCVVRLLAEMLAPYKGRVYDPCCGSGGMFVSSEKFIEEHGGRVGDIAVYGQESNPTTWRLAKMNLAIRGIEANLGPEHADTFHRDLHPDLKADYILANPHFNDSDWGGERLREDVRWKYGTPPVGNANFAWVQHFIHHLTPSGMAGFVLAKGSLSSDQSGEGEIRKSIIESDLVDCMVVLPDKLFYSTPIAACLWFLARDKNGGRFRDRRGQTLFIDARKLGRMMNRMQRELTEEDVSRIAATYHAWRGDNGAGKYEDVAGFCKSASIDEIRSRQHVLTPGRYVGAEDVENDDEAFETKFPRLLAKLEHEIASGDQLSVILRAALRRVGVK